MEIKLNSTQETANLAQKLALTLKPGDVVALYGDLGSGKTTFTSYLVKCLGIPARVQSPTFVVARKYVGLGNNKIATVNHLDLYRLTKKEELNELGLHELFSELDSVTVIEWPEIADSFLPENTIKIYFDVINETARKVIIKNAGI